MTTRFLCFLLVTVIVVCQQRVSAQPVDIPTRDVTAIIPLYEFVNPALEQQLEKWSAQIVDSMITRRPDTTEYDLTVRIRDEITYAEFKAFTTTREDILSASNSQIR